MLSLGFGQFVGIDFLFCLGDSTLFVGSYFISAVMVNFHLDFVRLRLLDTLVLTGYFPQFYDLFWCKY